MKFFFGFFAVATVITGIFTLTDSAGSGAGWACIIFAVLGIAVGGYNWIRNGSPMAESRSLNDQNGPQ
jgi:F0F1-type ATP synthase assembly protein I